MTYTGLVKYWGCATPQSSFKEELASKQAVSVKFPQEFFTPHRLNPSVQPKMISSSVQSMDFFPVRRFLLVQNVTRFWDTTRPRLEHGGGCVWTEKHEYHQEMTSWSCSYQETSRSTGIKPWEWIIWMIKSPGKSADSRLRVEIEDFDLTTLRTVRKPRRISVRWRGSARAPR